MFNTYIFILERVCLLLCSRKKLLKSPGRIHLIRSAAYLRQLIQFSLEGAYNFPGIQFGICYQLGNQTVLLLEQSHVQVFAIHLLMSFFNGDVLAIYYCLLCFLC